MKNYIYLVASLTVLCTTITPRISAQRRNRQCFLKIRPSNEPSSCDYSARYRTISGRCNNLVYPEWGSAGQTLKRLLPNAYEDGATVPRGGRHPSTLPNPRWISQRNHPDSDIPDYRFTHMVMQFGQFLDHDITLTPKDDGTDCCKSGVQESNCFTIPIPSPDRFYSWVNSSAQCLNFVRSRPVCRSTVREQFNEITAFVDASNIYGSELEHSAILRTYRDGRLHRNSITDQMPTREQLNIRPDTNLLRPESSADFMAGDMRINEHPFLTSIHTVFLREHNRIAKLLKEYLPYSLQTDEIIYQETRRIVGAEMQNIAYGEYLPTILGVDFMKNYGLIVTETSEYDSKVDPTIFNNFAGAAFRFGHSMVNGMFKLVSQRNSRTNSKKDGKEVYWLWRLREVFDGQSIRGERLPLENMIEGLITQEPQTCDAFFSTEITDHLFQKNYKRENFGEDLLALNIQRGRDHGLPGYNAYRKACGLRSLTDWSQRPTELNEEMWTKIEEVYDHVDDIDVYIGGIAETSVRGGVVGPTFACLIADQFRRLKFGDRFFYTHDNANGLGKVAREQVLQRTLGDVLCDVTRLGKVQSWVTLQPNTDYNPYKSCSSNSQLDVRAIAEEITEELSRSESRSGRVPPERSSRSGNNFPERSRSRSRFPESSGRFPERIQNANQKLRT